jgi:hypothetical protein
VTTAQARQGTGSAHRSAWHPLLFAAYPVLFLWSQNLGETNAGDVLPVLAVALVVAAVPFVVLARLFRDARRAALIVTPIIFALFMFGHVATLLAPVHIRTVIQLAGWAGLIGLGFLAAVRLDEARLGRVSGLLDGLGAALVVVTLVMIVPSQVTAAAAVQVQPSASPTNQTSASRPLRDVYYLVLDRYGSDRALSLRFGVENDLTPWLVEHGFRVLADSHANYVKTSMSMASTLNMTHLVDLAGGMGAGSDDHGPLFAMLQGSRVVEQFKALGYEYFHIGSYYGPTRTDTAADHNLYVGGPSDFAAAVIDMTAVPPILQGLRMGQTTIWDRAYANGLFDWEALASIRDAPGPKLVIGHFLLPHPPYAFAADGHFVDQAAGSQVSEADRFAGQLTWTNSQLKAWIESLLALPEDRRPVIVLQADEGPYPVPYQSNTVEYDWSTATTSELQQKFGILNAWYVPDGSDPGLYDSMTSVNTFPVLFSGILGLDVGPLLEDREYTSAGKNRPYDLTEITQRLASPAP